MRIRYKKLAGLLLAAVLAAFLLGAAPGSKSDPLVTASWVEQYVDRQIAGLSGRLDDIADGFEGLLVVRLWMGRAYMEQDGQNIELEAAPFVTSAGRSFVPLRALGEAIGAEFDWNNETKRVTYRRGDRQIEMRVGSANIVADGKTLAIDAPPQLLNNRVFVPIRVISENLGFAVNWLSAEKCAVITYGE